MGGIVNGVHQTKELQLMLKKFIIHFILCPKCKMPELQFKVHQKKNVLLQKCAACGWKGNNKSNHKVKTYIINHPPVKDKKKDKKKEKGKKSKKSKKEKNGVVAGDDDLNVGDIDYKELGGDDDEVWSVDISDDAVAQRKQQEMKTLATKNKQAKNKKKDKENDGKKKKDLNDNSPPQILRNYVNSAERSYLEILDEIKRISLARKFDQKKKLQLTIEALCKLDTLERFIESLRKYKVILQSFTANANDAKVFFGVLEEFVCRRNPDAFLAKVYVILECLYDEEIVSEEDMLKWAELASDKAVIVEQEEAESIRANAAVFIQWLRENEDDSDDDDDDEEEEDE